jgi:uncharacterized integral membrane protein (TIGR00698 family)
MARVAAVMTGRQIFPGLLACLAIAFASIRLKEATGVTALNPVVVALAVGIVLRASFGLPAALRPGAAFAVRPLLRAAIILLGLQVTIGQLASVGAGALGLAVASVALTIPFTIWLGSQLRVDPALAQLIGTGTGICGASAIVAANQVSRGSQEDVAYALAVITLCGTAALLAYPALAPLLGLSPRAYGLWAGSSIHEVVQAVGAAAAGGPVSAEIGTITKLARVVLLAPAILALGAWVARAGLHGTDRAGGAMAGRGRVKAPMPWFAFGFLAMVGVASTHLVPPSVDQAGRQLVPLMLAASVAALGLNTNLAALRAKGVRPLLLGVGATVFVSLLGLLGATLLDR